MPRQKKAEEDFTEGISSKETFEDLRQEVIKLGLDICKGFKDGRVRPESSLVNALTELFKAVKE